MNMSKQCAVVVLMAITGLMSAMSWAAREVHTFEVSLTVPSRAFYIMPSEPDWIYKPQRLVWDPTSNLSGLRRNFDVLHDTSAIEARLESAPYLSNGRPNDDIALRVRFNGVELSTVMRQVVSREEAAAGKRVALEIDPIKPLGGYRAGDYAGNVLLLFNARAPGE